VKESIIKRYEYKNYILLCDVLTNIIADSQHKLKETTHRFLEYIQEDTAKMDHGEELQI
jgi:hypothetical protein